LEDHDCLHQEFVLNIFNQGLEFFVHSSTIAHMFDTYSGHIFDIMLIFTSHTKWTTMQQIRVVALLLKLSTWKLKNKKTWNLKWHTCKL
jgi:hypothetical protein